MTWIFDLLASAIFGKSKSEQSASSDERDYFQAIARREAGRGMLGAWDQFQIPLDGQAAKFETE
jgi:hypothetical protein